MNRSPRRTTPSHTPAPPAITRIGMLALTRSSVRCWKAHATRWKNATRSAKTPIAVSGPRPTKANRQSVVTSALSWWRRPSRREGLKRQLNLLRPPEAFFLQWRLAPGPIAVPAAGDAPEVNVAGAAATLIRRTAYTTGHDPEDQARRRALDDPFHRHPNSAPTQSIRRDQPPYSMREWIADKALNVTDQCGAERDFGTHELLVICHCRRKHRAHPTRVCLLLTLATLPERFSPNISHAALASSQPTPA